LLFLLLFELAAVSFLVPLVFAVGARRVVIVLPWFALFGLGGKCGHASSGLGNSMVFLGNNLISDPFARNQGRIGASEDSANDGVRWWEVERKEMGDGDVGDVDASGLKLLSSKNDAVELWL
jgi:hypothetical protein